MITFGQFKWVPLVAELVKKARQEEFKLFDRRVCQGADQGMLGAHGKEASSSAAKGIASRKGLGKVRRIDVNQMWLQDNVHEGIIIIVSKIAGTHNQADILTKHVTAKVL